MHAAANWLQPRLIWWLATASASHGMIHNIAFQPIPYPGGRFEPKNRSRGPAWKAYRFWGLSRNLTKKNPRDTCDAKGGLGHLAPKIAVESLSSISSIQHISWIFMILQHVVVTWLGPSQFLAEPVLSCKLPSWHEFSDFLADPADTLRHDSLVVAAMGSDSSHGVHHCPQSPGDTLAQLIVDIAPAASLPWIQPRRRRCTAWDSPSPRARGMTRGSWDGGWLMAKARRCSSDTWPNWRRRAGRWRINRRRTRRDRGCWRPLRTLMRCKQQRSLWSRRRRGESGFEKDLVGISHDWVSKWPSTSTSSTIWREFHPHQNNFEKTTRKRW